MITNVHAGGNGPFVVPIELPAGNHYILADSLQLDQNGTPITAHFSGTAPVTWTSIAASGAQSVDVSVPGAAVGNTVAVGVYPALADKVLVSGHVRAADIVRVTIFNATGSALTPTAGTVRADVWQH